MRIALASDHAGYELKAGISRYLAEQAAAFTDLGCGPNESVDYVDFAVKGAAEVLSGACDRAILVCGTGMGMAVAANKFKGIRATPCWNLYTAEMSRRHNDANCLTLGGRTTPLADAIRIVQVWLDTSFEGGRHARRVDKIKELEERHFKP
ncbi:MAG: ribose 5-phosphate isomerase B [Candidatus Aminicenantes bacterium]|nr:ribose 5-phosphate isomerase B [Candidatus Aminicenantes bacterium]